MAASFERFHVFFVRMLALALDGALLPILTQTIQPLLKIVQEPEGALRSSSQCLAEKSRR